MARGRMISTSIAEDIEFNAMSMEAKMLFMMAIPHLDRDGLISGHTAILQGRICPLMPDMLPRMPAIIGEWETAELVIIYTSGRAPALFFTGFAKNQNGMRYEREAPSMFEAPPGYKRTRAGLMPFQPDADRTHNPNGSTPPGLPDNAGVSPEFAGTSAGVSPPEVKDQDQDQDQRARGSDPVIAAPSAANTTQPTPPVQVLRGSVPSKKPPVTVSSPHLRAAPFVPEGFIPSGQGTNPVQVYYERFCIRDDRARLTAPLEDDLIRHCPDLERLRPVVEEYSRHLSYKPGNIQLIVDWYNHGPPARPVATQGKRDWGILKPEEPDYGHTNDKGGFALTPDQEREIRERMLATANRRAAALAEQQGRPILPA